MQWKKGVFPAPGPKNQPCPDYERKPVTPRLADRIKEGQAAAAAAQAATQKRRNA